MKKVFRFDDICINGDTELANNIADQILKKYPRAKIIYAVSPMVHDMSSERDEVTKQRIFPRILNAYSDPKVFYKVDLCGVPPNMHKKAKLAAHGVVHVDHRLLNKSAQEMSILVSASLVKAKIFVPPFNKWNSDTEEICKDNAIDLVKFEDGWKCVEYNKFESSQSLWYLHHREFTKESFKKWLKL